MIPRVSPPMIQFELSDNFITPLPPARVSPRSVLSSVGQSSPSLIDLSGSSDNSSPRPRSKVPEGPRDEHVGRSLVAEGDRAERVFTPGAVSYRTRMLEKEGMGTLDQ